MNHQAEIYAPKNSSISVRWRDYTLFWSGTSWVSDAAAGALYDLSVQELSGNALENFYYRTLAVPEGTGAVTLEYLYADSQLVIASTEVYPTGSTSTSSVTANSIIGAAWLILGDDGTRHPVADMLFWLSDGQSEIAAIKVGSYGRVLNHPLASGTLQSVPGDLIRLNRAVRNVAADSTPGPVPNPLHPRTMDNLHPGWHQDTADKTVQVCLYDPDHPKVFWVYPPQPDTTDQLLCLDYAAIPPRLTTGEQAISLPDEYRPALLDYLCYRAEQSLTDPAAQGRATAHHQNFAVKVGAVQPQSPGTRP